MLEREREMDYLSVCAIFRDEDSYLDEWVQYHKIIGVEHIYLVSHEPNPIVSTAILKPYIDQGFVTLWNTKDIFDGDGKYDEWCQHDVQRWFINYTKDKTYWLGMIDVDEFILPKGTDDLRVWLENYEDKQIHGIAIHWKKFGTSGFITHPQSQINQLLRCGNSCPVIKSIIKPRYNREYTIKYGFGHHFESTQGWTVNANRQTIRANRVTGDMCFDKIQINHYGIRCLLYFYQTKMHRCRGHRYKNSEEWIQQMDLNDFFDDEISRRFGKHFPMYQQ